MNVITIREALKYFDDKAELEVLSNGEVIGFAIEIGGDKGTPYLEARVDNSIAVTQHIEDIPKKTFNMLGGGLVTPFVTTQSLEGLNMTIEEFENTIEELLNKDFEVNYEKNHDEKFLQIISDNILVFGNGKTWNEAFNDGIKSLKAKLK